MLLEHRQHSRVVLDLLAKIEVLLPGRQQIPRSEVLL